MVKVIDDDKLHGITIRGREFKISQFADDTVFLLNSHRELARMWELVRGIWEPATGMLVNVTKTEGLRLGGLRNPLLDRHFRDHVSASVLSAREVGRPEARARLRLDTSSILWLGHQVVQEGRIHHLARCTDWLELLAQGLLVRQIFQM